MLTEEWKSGFHPSDLDSSPNHGTACCEMCGISSAGTWSLLVVIIGVVFWSLASAGSLWAIVRRWPDWWHFDLHLWGIIQLSWESGQMFQLPLHHCKQLLALLIPHESFAVLRIGHQTFPKWFRKPPCKFFYFLSHLIDLLNNLSLCRIHIPHLAAEGP